MTTTVERQLAYRAGALTARLGRPLADCPYDPDSDPLLAMCFVRGYRGGTQAITKTTEPDLHDFDSPPGPQLLDPGDEWVWVEDELLKYESWWPRDARGRWVKRSHLTAAVNAGEGLVDVLRREQTRQHAERLGLRTGEHARVTGIDRYGKPTTHSGFVTGVGSVFYPEKRGSKKGREMLSVGVAEHPDGLGGWRGTIYVDPDAPQPPHKVDAADVPKPAPSYVPDWRPATYRDRADRMKELGKLTRSEFDALPEAERHTILNDLRSIAGAPDTYTHRSERGNMRGLPAPHVTAAQFSLRHFTDPIRQPTAYDALQRMKVDELRSLARTVGAKASLSTKKHELVRGILNAGWKPATGIDKAAAPDDKAGGVDPKEPTPPPDQRWPGWLMDTAIAAAVTKALTKALTAGLGIGSLIAALAHWVRGYRPGVDPAPDARTWLEQSGLPEQLTEAITPPIRQAHIEGWLVGERSAQALLDWAEATGDDPRNAVEISVNWGDWEPGHPDAARLLLSPGGLQRLLAQSGVTIKRIAAHRLDQVGRIIGEGLRRGDTPDEIAKQLLLLVRDRGWARMVAITETNRALSAAAAAVYEQAGIWGKGWMTALDQRVCKICARNERDEHGREVRVPLGGLFPSRAPFPPAHPRCRCALVPVFEPELDLEPKGGATL